MQPFAFKDRGRSTGTAGRSVGWAVLFFSFAMMMAGNPNRGSAAAPGIADAIQFGYELQKDYTTRGSLAVIDRVGWDGMRETTFTPFGRQEAMSEEVKGMWRNSLMPVIKTDLGALDGLPILQFSRILSLEGRRAIECLLLNGTGGFQIITFWLDWSESGKLEIVDFRMLGVALEMTRRLRHTFILLGAPFSQGFDEEEGMIHRYGSSYHHVANRALGALGKGNGDEAYRQWAQMPPSIRGTRIWLDVRQLMTISSPLAQQAVQTEYLQGGLKNQFLRYGLAWQAKNFGEAAEALGFLIREHHQQAFLRALRAEVLIEDKQFAQARAMAQIIASESPFSQGAQLVTVRAAVALGQPDEALRDLQRWVRVLPADEIDRLIDLSVDLADFRKSPPYLEWLATARVADASAAITPVSP